MIRLNRLKELREKNHLTLRKLGEKVNMSSSRLSQYETKRREPKLDTWQKLADYFGVSVPYLQGINIDIDDIVDQIDVNELSTLGLSFYEKGIHDGEEGLALKDLKLHANMTTNLLYGSKKSALESMNSYIGFLLNLRDKVSAFDSEKFENDYLYEIVEDSWDESKSNLASLNNELIQEVIDRVEKGNKELRDYLVKDYISGDSDILKSYLKYKKKNNEDTKKLNNCLKKLDEQFKKENPKLYKLIKNLE